MSASSRPSKSYDEMTVIELRSLLRARGQSTTGKKAELIERLGGRAQGRSTSPAKISSKAFSPSAYASHRHTSPTRAAAPVRVSASSPARLRVSASSPARLRVSASSPARLRASAGSPKLPSGLGSSSGATLEARRISLHHYIMAGFPNDEAVVYAEESVRPTILDVLNRPGFEGLVPGQVGVDILSEWQMDEVRSLSLDRLAAAEQLMDILDANALFAPQYYDGEYDMWPMVGFLIDEGNFVLRRSSKWA